MAPKNNLANLIFWSDFILRSKLEVKTKKSIDMKPLIWYNAIRLAVYWVRSDIMISEADKKNLAAGYKQTMKALSKGCVSKVFIARDCEDRLSNEINAAANSCNAQIIYVDTMQQLGELCGIGVKTSCAVILKA